MSGANPSSPVSSASPGHDSLGADQAGASALARRDSVGIRYDLLTPDFLELMARIAHYGATKYGDHNWMKSRLRGEHGPVNHIYGHLHEYTSGQPYDHPSVGIGYLPHLAAIAFNAMMEYWYESHSEIK